MPAHLSSARRSLQQEKKYRTKNLSKIMCFEQNFLSESLRMLQKGSQAYEWYKAFKDGRETVEEN
ncbi:Putative DD34D transposase, partial [Caligus rogercresseyi]